MIWKRMDAGWKQSFGCGAGVAHVDYHFPGAVFLLLPDGGVFAVVDSGLAISVLGFEDEVAVGVAEVATCGHVSADGLPGEGRSFRPGVLFPHVVAGGDAAAIVEFDAIVGHVDNEGGVAVFGDGLGELGFELKEK